MLFKIVNDFQPSQLVVAFDRAAPTFRKEMFKAYQAKRPKMDEDLVPQVDQVHELLTAFKIPVYEMDGYEADDIIGTLCREVQRSKLKVQVIVVTGDKDLLQLVKEEKVLVFMPTKGLSEGRLYGVKEVRERMGVSPDKIPDLKALAGDASDNYPGVPGVGPKTAVELLKKFGSVEKLFKAVKKHQAKLNPALLTRLEEGIESAEMSHRLATIKTDVPIEIDWQKMNFAGLDTDSARRKLEELHFPSLLKRLDKTQNQPSIKLKLEHEFNEAKDKKESKQQELF